VTEQRVLHGVLECRIYIERILLSGMKCPSDLHQRVGNKSIHVSRYHVFCEVTSTTFDVCIGYAKMVDL